MIHLTWRDQGTDTEENERSTRKIKTRESAQPQIHRSLSTATITHHLTNTEVSYYFEDKSY